MTDAEQLNTLKDRIAEIDRCFSEATNWGSWMVELANERESIVNRLRAQGYPCEHKYTARSANGGKVS
jgi:hypothetical protein